jgi:hypothetical protein
MTRDEWLKQGIELGFCSPAICYTHDGLPTTDTEDLEMESDDVCITIIRPYKDADEQKSVESNFSPAVWRKIGQAHG